MKTRSPTKAILWSGKWTTRSPLVCAGPKWSNLIRTPSIFSDRLPLKVWSGRYGVSAFIFGSFEASSMSLLVFAWARIGSPWERQTSR